MSLTQLRRNTKKSIGIKKKKINTQIDNLMNIFR